VKPFRLLFMVFALAVAACANVNNFVQKNSLVSQVVVQEATMHVIEAGKTASDRAARAARINVIVALIRESVDNQAVTLDDLAVLAHSKIAGLSLQSSDSVLANAVVDAAVQALKDKIGAGTIPKESVYTVDTVLTWISGAAAIYPSA
jgi:hypothetical protein